MTTTMTRAKWDSGYPRRSGTHHGTYRGVRFEITVYSTGNQGGARAVTTAQVGDRYLRPLVPQNVGGLAAALAMVPDVLEAVKAHIDGLLESG